MARAEAVGGYGLAIGGAERLWFGRADEAFLERLRAGEPEAFEVLVTQFHADIYRLLYRLLGNSEEARDATQETFLRAYRHIRRFRGQCDVKTWIYRIAVNYAANRHRWWGRVGSRTISLEASQEETGPSLAETLADPQADPEQRMIAQEEEALLLEAMARLRSPFRVALLLRDVEGLTYEEIASVLQVSVGTVRSRIARGREMLRREIQRLRARHRIRTPIAGASRLTSSGSNEFADGSRRAV